MNLIITNKIQTEKERFYLEELNFDTLDFGIVTRLDRNGTGISREVI